MSIIDKIIDKMDDAVWEAFDKVEENIDLMDRRMIRRFEKLEAKEDNFNALFGLEKYKGASLKQRFTAVFSEEENSIKTTAEYGDIICVGRGTYKHYAIYIGDNKVIHYVGQNKDFDIRNFKDAVIKEDDMDNFLKGSNEYFVFDCESKGKHKLKINPKLFNAGIAPLVTVLSLFNGRELLVAFSPEETVQRAKSKLGERKYNVAINNCEHFAIWCKTGIHKSTQVDNVLELLTMIPIKVNRIINNKILI